MAVQVRMPTFGMTEGEATITGWFKAVGDAVEADEPLFEAETEKATLEVPAPSDGVLLRVDATEGQTVPLKAVVGWLGRPGEEVPAGVQDGEALPSAARESAVRERLGAMPSPRGDQWIRVSPLARRLAREHSIELSTVEGTGPGGRIVEADIRLVIEAEPQTAEEGYPGPKLRYDLLPLTTLRRVTAERLALSFHTTVPVPLFVDVDMSEAKRFREKTRVEYERHFGTACPYNALTVRVCALALRDHPALNVQWTEQGVRLMREINIGLAMAVDDGLLVPVIQNADKKSLGETLAEINELIHLARGKGLSPEQMSGGTFTVTNLGGLGVDAFTPVINPPEAAILGVGRIVDRVVAVSGQPTVRPVASLCLVFDHRALDGAVAATFLARIKTLLENPYLLS